jgi:hypothetical protein
MVDRLGLDEQPRHILYPMFALALWTSFVLAVAPTGSLYAVPALVVIGAIAWFFQRQSGYRFFAAAAICVLPLVTASLLWE